MDKLGPFELNRTHIGNCLDLIRQLPDGCVHCIVTSPPYFALRDYGIEPTAWPEVEYQPMPGLPPLTIPAQTCCLGLEKTPEAYVGHLVLIARELGRVLRDDGTFWLNIGDSFITNPGNGRGGGEKVDGGIPHYSGNDKTGCGLPQKNLIGIPWRLAFALQADGWWLRRDVIWAKGVSFLPDYAGSSMPESVRDRPTSSHEYLFLLTKSQRYFYDNEAVKETLQTDLKENYPARAKITGRGNQQSRNQTPGMNSQQDASGGYPPNGEGRNLRSVWVINPRPYKEAHFAVFPPDLVRPCILAGTSEKGCCPECGVPWQRVVEKSRTFESGSGKAGNLPIGKNGPNMQGGGETIDIRRGPVVHSTTTGWRPTCTCDAGDPVPAVVLDPFMGSGTVGQVALEHRRDFIGFEANSDYQKLTDKRLDGLQPWLFNKLNT